jgi:hypothetical protein
MKCKTVQTIIPVKPERAFLYKRLHILIITLLLTTSPLCAQIYESVFRPKLDWYELNSPRFRIIFHEGEEDAARTTARLLEDQYRIVQSLVGGSTRRLPVVLNGYNDNSNGFVTPLHFRIEMEVPSIRGKSMNPRTGGWLENVVPHELVHALHMSVAPAIGVGGLIRPFSPDLSRMVHLAAPLGLFEGIAVFHETNMVYQEGGRGNYPYFTRHFSSRVQHKPWRLAQMHQSPVASRPFNRIYAGGYEFTSWLLYEHGMETTQRTIRFVSRFPFLGYGAALWSVTGQSPSKLYREFMTDKLEEEEERLHAIERTGVTAHQVVETGRRGDEVRRPLWLGEDMIVFYGSFYNDRPGFRTIHLPTGRMSMLLESRVMNDFRYDLDPDRRNLVFSRYHPHPWHHNTFGSDLHRFTLGEGDFAERPATERPVAEPSAAAKPAEGWPAMEPGSLQRLTRGERLFAPAPAADGSLHALQTDHESARWVRLTPATRGHASDDAPGKAPAGACVIETILEVRPDNLVAIAPNPADAGLFAVVANRNGVQALWLVRSGSERDILERDPDIGFRNAVIFDPQWSPDGSKLLMSSDYGGVLNLYEYDVADRSMMQVTNSRYNAFEGSYSPDGNRIAFVTLEQGYHRLAVIGRDDFQGTGLSDTIWRIPSANRMQAGRLGSHLDEASQEWEIRPYRGRFSFLRPRMVVPMITDDGGIIGLRPGVMLAGGDVLRRNDYTLAVSASNNRLWYDVTYRNRSFFPGISLSGFREPTEVALRQATTQNGTLVPAILDETGLRAGIPLTLTLDTYARSSWISLEPSVRFGFLEAIDRNGNVISNRSDNARYGMSLAWYHRLQQNIRDHQPNTGFVAYAQTDQEFYTTGNMLRRGVRGGLIGFFSPSLSINHSLRVGVEAVWQSRLPIYSLSGLSREFDGNILTGFRNAGSLRFRYTIPLATVDRGSLTVPLFLHRTYLVLFTNTAASLDRPVTVANTRTIYGAGLRFRFDLFNLPVDLGVAFGYEVTRGTGYGWVGDF